MSLFQVWVLADGLRLRKHPGTHAGIVYALPKGTPLYRVGPNRMPDGPDHPAWAQVVRTARDKPLWCAAEYLAAAYVAPDLPPDAPLPVPAPLRAALQDFPALQPHVTILTAIAAIESGLRDRTRNGGRLERLYEPAVYAACQRRCPKQARAELTARATSWGAMQCLGGHFPQVHLASALDYVDWMRDSPVNEYRGGCQYVLDRIGLEALQRRDWMAIAQGYNGAGERRVALARHRTPYDELLPQHAERVVNEKRRHPMPDESGPSPDPAPRGAQEPGNAYPVPPSHAPPLRAAAPNWAAHVPAVPTALLVAILLVLALPQLGFSPQATEAITEGVETGNAAEVAAALVPRPTDGLDARAMETRLAALEAAATALARLTPGPEVLPTATPTATPAPTAVTPQAATLNGNYHLRTGPGTDMASLAVLSAGTDVWILNCGAAWVQVQTMGDNPQTGYVSRLGVECAA